MRAQNPAPGAAGAGRDNMVPWVLCDPGSPKSSKLRWKDG